MQLIPEILVMAIFDFHQGLVTSLFNNLAKAQNDNPIAINNCGQSWSFKNYLCAIMIVDIP